MATVKDKFKIINGLDVENASREVILSSDDNSLISERTTYLRGNTASDIPVVVESRTSQTADLQQWKDETGSVLASLDKDGMLYTQDIQTSNNVTIGGNLVVQGTTTTIESVIATVQDPILLIGGENPPLVDDNKDKGIEFRWHDGSTAKTGFFGFQDSNGKFTFIPDAGNVGEVISGNPGDILFNDAEFTGDVAVNGGDITTTSAIFNLVDDTATTVNFAGAAIDVQIGSNLGVTTINNDVDIVGDRLSTQATSFTAFDTPETISFGAAATDIGIGSSTGTTRVYNNLDVSGDIQVFGGDLIVSGTTVFNLANTTATTINFGGNATDIQIGSATGTTNVNNNLDVDGDLNIDGGDLTVSTSAFNLANTIATTVNFAGAATSVNIGSNQGTTSVNNALFVSGNITTDSELLDSSAATFNIADSSSTVNIASSATDIQIGSATGTTNINNDLDVDGDVNIDGGDLDATTTSFNLLASPTTLDIGASATDIQVGADTGTTTIRNNLTVEDILTITGPTTNFNPPTENTPPFTVGVNAYDVLVAGLNADKLDGQTGTWYQDRTNHTGQQPHTTISDWEEAVEDTVAPMFVHSQQSGIVAQYNDETGRILLTVAGGGGGGATDFGMLYWMGV